MSGNTATNMAKTRALMTDTERERLAGLADVDDIKVYQAKSRVRRRIGEELPFDLEILRENHPDLFDEVCDIVEEEKERGEKAKASGRGEKPTAVSGDDSGEGEGEGVEVWEASEGRGELPEDPPDRDQGEVLLRGMDLPGSGEDYERRVEAVLAIYDELRANPGERLSKSHFAALLDDTSVGYAGGFDSLWSNWVKSNPAQGHAGNVLEALPGVEMRGDAYVYTG